jgi:hypothetical protein
MAIKLGSKVKDKYTGFTGIAVSRTEFLYGCTRIGIEPTALHEGKPIESHYYDEQRVEVIEEAEPIVTKAGSTAGPGGPQRDVRRAPDPPKR